MAFIKKMVIQGFKSFAKRTEIPFDPGISIVIGPNGAGKSNVADALCFVLGRLSIKSMRAAKARNLIFMGSKYVKPAKEAFVELIFDNSDKSFSLETGEVSLKRMVRVNGQSAYKINGEIKTRNEVIEMLAQAGIDPYGFNLILQGQIQSIVKMHPDERRKVIEEVAGISIYESRKEKSLHELAKTDERLKEISTILRERTAYLKNLEREKLQAERYKHSELTVRRAKASIISKKIDEKKKELDGVLKSIGEKDAVKSKMREKNESIQKEIEELNKKINDINRGIRQATGLEQENLHNEIANLRAEIEGLRVRKESYENRRKEIERRIEQMAKSRPDLEKEIQELRKESPLMAKKASELKKKKDDLSAIENERKKLLTWKAELQAFKDRGRDKERQLSRVIAESESLIRRLEEYSTGLNYENEALCLKAIQHIRKSIIDKKERIKELHQKELENEKIISVSDASIFHAEKIRKDVDRIDICPLCQCKITEEHKKHVYADSEDKIIKARINREKAIEELKIIRSNREIFSKEIAKFEEDLSKGEIELGSHRNMNEKKEQLKNIVAEEKVLRSELSEIEDKRKKLESRSFDIESIEEQYHRKMMEIEEISSRTNEDIDTTLLYKEREIENIQNIIKRSSKDIEDIDNDIGEISEKLENKSNSLDEKEEAEEELQKQFKKMFEERDIMQKKIQEKNISYSEGQQEYRQIEDQINYLKIGKAKLDAEREASEMEFSEYAGIELLQGSAASIEDRLKKAQEALQNIGSINMRALEVYEEIKKEYDIVQEKVDILQKEKEDIMKIIEEIDRKKTRSFMKTFKSLNELFSENFSKLSSKGVAYLEIENQEDIFAGGIFIVVRLAKGKYFDVTSLSGGEQTLVALSLLFAIQEYKPYHFYVFDEIDAALDKRNSERLSALLSQYMKSGQYIVITHNDAIIINSNVLYGVSMHEGVSKILSLKIGEVKENSGVNAGEKEIEKSVEDNQNPSNEA
ncbi:MAG: chromosome segregation SMC family protein [Nanoarchaeota archaeon]|nr:chromosome segregation SMC family protein [Nanoarchaeota archaeon]